MSDRDNLDDELAEEWKQIQARHMSADDEPAETEPDEPEDAAEDAPARDEKGRFASAGDDEKPAEGEDKPEATAAPETAPEPAAEAPAEAAPEDAPARDLNRPPSSWKPAAKAAWDALPADIRAEVHRRESDFLKGQSQLLPDAELGRSMRQVVEPYRMLIEAEGGTPETAVQHLLQTAALFRVGTVEQKQAALAQIAQQYGIPMPVGGEQAQYGQPQQFRDPRFDQFLQQQEMERLQREADSRRREQAETTRLESVVQAWSNAVDSQGKALRPYFGNVEAELAALIPQIRATNPEMRAEDVLQQAYDRAVWAHPEIRPLLLKQQQDEIEAKRRAENQLRVKEAKKAASVNVPRRASVPAATDDRRGLDRMDDVIADTARELGLLN